MALVFFPEYEGKSCHLPNAPFAGSEFKLLGFPHSQGFPMCTFTFPACFHPTSLLLPSPFMDKLLLCNNFPTNHANLFRWERKFVPGFFFCCFLPQTDREDQSLHKQQWCFSLHHKTLTPEIHLLKALGHDYIPFPFQFLGFHLHGLWVRPSRAEEGTAQGWC